MPTPCCSSSPRSSPPTCVACTRSRWRWAYLAPHDERELDAALEVDAEVIGINNRDLTDFSVDIRRTFELLSDVPAGKAVVSESGYSLRDELDELDRVGVDAVLIGEWLMRAPDVEAACRELTGHGEGVAPDSTAR